MYYNPSEWSYAAKQGYHSVYKLGIEALSGATDLFLQFNYSAKKKMEDEPAYRTFLIMMYNSIAWRYKEKGLNKYSNETFYYVRCTDNFSGFCIDIEHETAENADDAFPIVALGLNFVLNFNPDQYSYPDADFENLIRQNLDKAKNIAKTFKEDIFDKKLVSFKKEYVDPFD